MLKAIIFNKFKDSEKSSKWQKVTRVAKSPPIRLQGVSRGFRWFQVSNSIGSDDSGDLRAGTLRVRGARLPAEGRQASKYKITKNRIFKLRYI